MTSKSVMESSPQSAILAGNAATKSSPAQGSSSSSAQFADEFHSALQDRPPTNRAETSKSTAAPAAPANVTKQQPAVATNFTRDVQQSDAQTIDAKPSVPAVPATPVTDTAEDAAKAALLALIARSAPLSTQVAATNKAGTADAAIDGSKDKKAKKADSDTSTEATDAAAAAALVPGLPVIAMLVPATPVTASDSNTSTETRENTATPSDNSQPAQTLAPLSPLPTPASPAATVTAPATPAETSPSAPTGKESEAFAMLLTPKTTAPPQQPAAKDTSSNTPSGTASKSDASAASQPVPSAKQAVNAAPVVDDNASNQAPPERKTATSSATNSGPATPSSLEQDSDIAARNPKPQEKEEIAATAGTNDAAGTKQDFGGFGSAPGSFVGETKVSHNQSASAAAPSTPAVEMKDSAAAATGSAKEVAIRLEGQSGQTINVKLVDQGGQVQVSVRSNDPVAATALRGDLSSLASNLDKAGWKPEITTLASASSMESVSQTRQPDRNNQDSQSSRQPDWQQQDTPRKRQTVSDLWDQLLTTQNT